MGGVMVLDAAMIRRWFASAMDGAGRPQHLRLELTVPERDALRAGCADLLTALTDADAGTPELAELAPGAPLAGYLGGVAAGLGQARVADGWEPGVAAPLHLAAGLIAGAAALAATTPAPDSGTGPGAAESAHRAGVAAAEAVVTGADLGEMARAAELAIQQGWLPTPATADLRTHLLLTLLLTGLAESVAGPRTGPDATSCGGRPGENAGVPFAAEVTFTLHGAPSDAEALHADLAALPQVQEVQLWQQGDRALVHLHTDDPGPVVERAYLLATPFDLRITRRQV
jgi:hypothetical protein